MHATAGGIYELWAGGERITPGSLAPGWTDYDTRVAFHTYDLTRLFEAEEAVYVGRGRRGRLVRRWGRTVPPEEFLGQAARLACRARPGL